jgi:hypothetical protein
MVAGGDMTVPGGDRDGGGGLRRQQDSLARNDWEQRVSASSLLSIVAG